MPQAVKNNNARVTTRIIIVFAFTFLAILGLTLVYRLLGMSTTAFITRDAMGVLAIVMIFVTAALVIIAAILSSRNSAKAGVFWAAAAGAAILLISFSSLRIFYIDAVKVLYVFIPALAVLYLIYLIYQREFFTLSMIIAAYSAGFWVVQQLCERDRFAHSIVCIAAMLAVLAFMTFVLIPFTDSRNGKIKIGGKTVELAKPNTDYSIYRLSFGVLALCLLAVLISAFIGMYIAGRVSYYSMLISFGYLFIIAVYYTVKMIGE